MISPERMKSVRIAPLIVFASASGPCITEGTSTDVVVVVGEPVVDLLGPLETEVGTADHQDDLDEQRGDGAEDQRRREDEQELVAQRTERDLLDDRQLTLGGEVLDVGGRDGRVVDDDPGGLDARSPGRGADVVDRCGRQLRQRGDVIQ